MDRWLHSAARRTIFRMMFHLAVWGNLGAFLAIFLYDRLGVPDSYFGALVIVATLFGLPGVLALLILLVGMVLCVVSSRRLRTPEKVIWGLGFLAFHIIALSIYYLAVYRREATEMQAEHV